jgi:hypothetical protein
MGAVRGVERLGVQSEELELLSIEGQNIKGELAATHSGVNYDPATAGEGQIRPLAICGGAHDRLQVSPVRLRRGVDSDRLRRPELLRVPQKSKPGPFFIRVYPYSSVALLCPTRRSPRIQNFLLSPLNNFDPPQLHFFTFTKQPG